MHRSTRTTSRPALFIETLEARRLLSGGAVAAPTVETGISVSALTATVTPIKMKGTYSGTWRISSSAKISFTFQITYQKGTKLRGVFTTGMGTGYFQLHGSTRGTNGFSLVYSNTAGGTGASMIIKVSGKIAGSKISGSASTSTGAVSFAGALSGKRI